MTEFIQFLKSGQYRFYQERDLGLDLYHNGWPGILLGVLAVASLVIFLLAIFHVIPARRHVVGLLLGVGFAAAVTGFAASYVHWRDLPSVEARLVRDTAGPLPASEEQRAAVIALPLVVGGATLAVGILGCLYMSVFWGGRALSKEAGPAGS